MSKLSRKQQTQKRHRRLRRHLTGTSDRPRLAVFRSNNHIYAQVIDDDAQSTLCSASTVDKELRVGLEANGGSFLCGCKPTIADCHLYPQVQYFVRGTADHVPKDCLKDFPVVLAWMESFRAIPEVAKNYGL